MNMREEITTPPRSARLPFQIRMSGISYCDGTYVIRRTASPILDADGLQIERHTIRAKPQTPIILA